MLPLLPLGLACTARVKKILVVIVLEDNNDDYKNQRLNKTKLAYSAHEEEEKTFSGIGMRLSTSLAWPEELPLLVAVVKNLLRVFFQ